MMRLDAVFTQIDVDKFTHPSRHHGSADRLQITAEGDSIKVKEMSGKLEDILEKYVATPWAHFIPCGGDRIAAEREQWNDGSNTLCIAPGTIVVYRRNDVTNALLRRRASRFSGCPPAELSRGRGGPLHEHAACAARTKVPARARLHAHRCYELPLPFPDCRGRATSALAFEGRTKLGSIPPVRCFVCSVSNVERNDLCLLA